jgi:hypothetical protein
MSEGQDLPVVEGLCDVCCGSGRYPVIDRRGRQLYEITCPECFGDGHIEGALDKTETKTKEPK